MFLVKPLLHHVFAACDFVRGRVCMSERMCVWVCVHFLTTIADIICGTKSHRALEQGSGNWQLESSFMVITADSTSWRTIKDSKNTVWVLDILCYNILYIGQWFTVAEQTWNPSLLQPLIKSVDIPNILNGIFVNFIFTCCYVIFSTLTWSHLILFFPFGRVGFGFTFDRTAKEWDKSWRDTYTSNPHLST